MAAKALDVDQATVKQLTQLPGIGKTFAQLIVQRREEQGSIYFEDMADVPALQTALHSLVNEGRVFFQPFPEERFQPRKAMEEPTIMNDQIQILAEALKGVQREMKDMRKNSQMEIERMEEQQKRMEEQQKRMEEQQKQYIREAINSVHQEMDRRFSLFPFVKPETGVPPQAVATPAVQTPIVEPIHEPAVQRMIDVIDNRTATHQPLTASPPPSAPPSPARAAPALSGLPSRGGLQNISPIPETNRRNFPKIAPFDGHGDFNAFLAKFEIIAASYAWDEQMMLLKLVESLTDKALDCFYWQKPEVKASYLLTKEELQKSFGIHVDPIAARAELSLLCQRVEEPVELYSQRVREMTTKAYLGVPADLFELLAMESFFRGFRDTGAARLAMIQSPKTLNDAMNITRSIQYNDRLLNHKSSQKVTFQRPPVSSGDSVRNSQDTGSHTVRQVHAVESSCLPDISKDVRDLKDQLKTISLNLGLEGNFHRTARDRESRGRSPTGNDQPRSGWRSPSPNPRSSSPSINCYNCGLEGHFIRDCPKRKGEGSSQSRQRYRSRSPSPATSRSASSLN